MPGKLRDVEAVLLIAGERTGECTESRLLAKPNGVEVVGDVTFEALTDEAGLVEHGVTSDDRRHPDLRRRGREGPVPCGHHVELTVVECRSRGDAKGLARRHGIRALLGAEIAAGHDRPGEGAVRVRLRRLSAGVGEQRLPTGETPAIGVGIVQDGGRTVRRQLRAVAQLEVIQGIPVEVPEEAGHLAGNARWDREAYESDAAPRFPRQSRSTPLALRRWPLHEDAPVLAYEVAATAGQVRRAVSEWCVHAVEQHRAIGAKLDDRLPPEEREPVDRGQVGGRRDEAGLDVGAARYVSQYELAHCLEVVVQSIEGDDVRVTARTRTRRHDELGGLDQRDPEGVRQRLDVRLSRGCRLDPGDRLQQVVHHALPRKLAGQTLLDCLERDTLRREASSAHWSGRGVPGGRGGGEADADGGAPRRQDLPERLGCHGGDPDGDQHLGDAWADGLRLLFGRGRGRRRRQRWQGLGDVVRLRLLLLVLVLAAVVLFLLRALRKELGDADLTRQAGVDGEATVHAAAVGALGVVGDLEVVLVPRRDTERGATPAGVRLERLHVLARLLPSVLAEVPVTLDLPDLDRVRRRVTAIGEVPNDIRPALPAVEARRVNLPLDVRRHVRRQLRLQAATEVLDEPGLRDPLRLATGAVAARSPRDDVVRALNRSQARWLHEATCVLEGAVDAALVTPDDGHCR